MGFQFLSVGGEPHGGFEEMLNLYSVRSGVLREHSILMLRGYNAKR